MYVYVVNGKLISECNQCKKFEHLEKCTLKINRYLHYSGVNPLALCYPDENFFDIYNKNDTDSIAFASLMAYSFNRIEP